MPTTRSASQLPRKTPLIARGHTARPSRLVDREEYAGMKDEVNERFPVVALVSSAGGLDALTRVLAPLPTTFPAAVIALQHTSPTAPAQLAAILGRRTALPVSS